MNDQTSNLDPQAEPTQAELVDAQVTPAESTALAPMGKEAALESVARKALGTITPQQARVMEVTDALAPAYARASQLMLSDEEIRALQEVFPDDAVEIRPNDGLIYIPHIHISNRLNRVLHPGQWATICRRHWLDRLMVERWKDGKKADVAQTTMYGEYVLVIRGCFVGESIGGHPYVASNAKTNFSDALESTRAEALRRICGKTLGVGSQVWDPSYARNWVQQYAYQNKGDWAKKPMGQTSPPQGSTPLPAATTQRQPTPPKQAAAGQSAQDAAADAANASRTRRATAPPSQAAPARKAPPAAQPAPGHACPKCRGTATKASEDWEGIRWCQRCGWQWDVETGSYYEAHDWAKVICTRPPKGMKLDEYRKAPQTLGQISRIDNKRWFGLVMNNSEAESAKGYTSQSGKHYPATGAELEFGRACEDAVDYLESQKEGREASKEEPPPEDNEDPDVPF